MKITIFHLSDMHFSDKNQIELGHVEKMVQVLNKTENIADEYMVIVSGDIANKGYKRHYNFADLFLSRLIEGIEIKTGKKALLCIVPGNHDVNFDNCDLSLEMIKKGYEDDNLGVLVSKYLHHMTDFFEYSSKHNCFSEGNRIVSKKCIEFDRMSLGVVLVNSAPFSLLGGNADDMGYHFLSDEDINKIKSIADCDYNILVIHHSIEWFSHDVKSQLREIIGSKYSLLLTGHEHESVGEEKQTNKLSRTSYVQGNALLGEASEGNGFDIVCIDTDINHMKAFSYIWKEDHYTSREILYSEIQKNSYND